MENQVVAPAIDLREIGAILKARREELNISQRIVADKLGLKNANFITMLEKGDSKIPIPRIYEITQAYNLNITFGYSILAATYPDVWAFTAKMQNAIHKEGEDTTEELHNSLAVFKKLKRSYKIKL